MSSRMMTGRSPGSVMCHMRRQRPAPSTAADSYRFWLMAARAARKMIVPHPASFQIIWEVTTNRKASGLLMTSSGA